MEDLGNAGFINYYGTQRFGTSSVPTHAVGVALLTEHFDTAIELVMMVRVCACVASFVACSPCVRTAPRTTPKRCLHARSSAKPAMLRKHTRPSPRDAAWSASCCDTSHTTPRALLCIDLDPSFSLLVFFSLFSLSLLVMTSCQRVWQGL